MITSILIITVIAVLGTWALRRLNQSGHQFPTAYQLLKSSPSIDRKEMWALKAIVAMAVIWFLLLLTSQF
jgi:hypothetical protein